MSRIRSGCCARAASGHTAAAPPISAMNLRRLICTLKSGQRIVPSQNNTWNGVTDVRFGSKADIDAHPLDVRFTPKADIAG
jgi:hypothetical protein